MLGRSRRRTWYVDIAVVAFVVLRPRQSLIIGDGDLILICISSKPQVSPGDCALQTNYLGSP
jgi:hypothetical protein